jgi:ketosteroid isomerase-like protein
VTSVTPNVVRSGGFCGGSASDTATVVWPVPPPWPTLSRVFDTRSPEDRDQANVKLRALAEAAFEALNSADLDRFLALTTEDVEFTSLIAEAEGTSFRGRDGVRTWWETVVASFQDVRWEMLELITVADDRGVIQLRIIGTIGDVPVEQTMWQASRVRDARISGWALFRTKREALEAAWLRE